MVGVHGEYTHAVSSQHAFDSQQSRRKRTLHLDSVHSTFFPNWQNSLATAKLQIIGHALLSTNFNTLHCHLQSWSCGRVLASKARGWGLNC